MAAKEQVPSIGRTVHYRLSAADVEAITRRRTTSASIAERLATAVSSAGSSITAYAWPAGAQAHIGNSVSEGQTVPLVITAVDEGNGAINGQAFLDGTDVLWVTGIEEGDEGDESGTWSWPPKV